MTYKIGRNGLTVIRTVCKMGQTGLYDLHKSTFELNRMRVLFLLLQNNALENKTT